MSPNRIRSWRGIVAVSILVLLAHARAEEEPSAPPDAFDPKAEGILREATDALAQAKTLTFNCHSKIVTRVREMSQEVTESYSVALKRPNRVAVSSQAVMTGFTIISDGKHSYILSKGGTRHHEIGPFKNMDELAGKNSPVLNGGSFNAMVFLLPCLGEHPYDLIMDGVIKSECLGEETIDDRPCHHMRYYQEGFDWDIWITMESPPLIRRVRPDMTKRLARTRITLPNTTESDRARTDFEVNYTDWAIDVEIPDERFQFTPPAGARNLDDVPEEPQWKDPAEELVGKPAPALELELLDGGRFDLASHKGKNIVILDFWASWCGPCIRGLPMVAGVAEEFRDRGVVLYAVNEGESANVARRLLEDLELDLNAALDTDSKGSDPFFVRGIPQTVIIDKEGIVRNVHVGFSPAMKDIIAGELNTILTGDDPGA